MRVKAPLLVLLCAVGAGSCGADGAQPSARDAGAEGDDAGARTDAGGHTDDAGGHMDDAGGRSAHHDARDDGARESGPPEAGSHESGDSHAGPTDAGHEAGGDDTYYFPDSMLVQLVPANPPLASYSQAVVNYFAAFEKPIGADPLPDVTKSGDGSVSDKGYSYPTYDSYATDPLVTVSCATPSWGCPNAQTTDSSLEPGEVKLPNGQVHVPAAFWPEGPSAGSGAPTGDNHNAVVDHSFNPPLVCDFYQQWAPSSSTGYVFSTGDTLKVTNGSCNPMTVTGVPRGVANHGHISFPGISMRASEVVAGHIGHALGIGVNCANSPTVYPSEGVTDATCPGAGPHYGDHLWIDLSDEEIDALVGPDDAVKTVYKALHDYGGYVVDTGFESSTVGSFVHSQDDVSSVALGKPGPWAQFFATEAVTVSSDGRFYWYLSNSTWAGTLGAAWWQAHLKILDPCVAQGNCS